MRNAFLALLGSLLFAAFMLWAVNYGWTLHDQSECRVWLANGYNLTQPMRNQCDSLGIR